MRSCYCKKPSIRELGEEEEDGVDAREKIQPLLHFCATLLYTKGGHMALFYFTIKSKLYYFISKHQTTKGIACKNWSTFGQSQLAVPRVNFGVDFPGKSQYAPFNSRIMEFNIILDESWPFASVWMVFFAVQKRILITLCFML